MGSRTAGHAPPGPSQDARPGGSRTDPPITLLASPAAVVWRTRSCAEAGRSVSCGRLAVVARDADAITTGTRAPTSATVVLDEHPVTPMRLAQPQTTTPIAHQRVDRVGGDLSERDIPRPAAPIPDRLEPRAGVVPAQSRRRSNERRGAVDRRDRGPRRSPPHRTRGKRDPDRRAQLTNATQVFIDHQRRTPGLQPSRSQPVRQRATIGKQINGSTARFDLGVDKRQRPRGTFTRSRRRGDLFRHAGIDVKPVWTADPRDDQGGTDSRSRPDHLIRSLGSSC
jgi:hypothetical protein